jgi:hypothetical protein
MKRLLTIVAIGIALLVTSKAFGDNESALGYWHNAEIALADREEAAGVAEWDTNRPRRTNESLVDCYERIMDAGGLQQNDGRYWRGFLYMVKRGTVR